MTKHSKPRVFLSEDDRAVIRRSNLTSPKLAEAYGVTVNTINSIIKSRKTKK